MPSRRTAAHFVGATASKLTPPALQLLLIFAVARAGGLEDVGKLSLASAMSFGCASLAEMGFMTSLSIPRTYFGTDAPPLRGTRVLRVGAALGGSALYGILWVGGMGGHDEALLILLPLPFLLALSYGYSGVMNAAGGLKDEGAVSVAESVFAVGVLVVFLAVVPPLPAALLALLLGRAAGTAARLWSVRRFPQSAERFTRDMVATQGWFLASTLAIVVVGQVDILVLGSIGAYVLLGVYAPMLRLAYGGLLVVEAVSWAMYGRNEPRHNRNGIETLSARRLLAAWMTGHWRATGVIFGVLLGLAFALVAPFALEIILGRKLDGILTAVAVFGAVIAIRTCTFVLTVDIIRAGRQRARIPVSIVAGVVLLIGATLAGEARSLSWLATARLVAETVVLAGYGLLVRGIRHATPRNVEAA